MDILKGQWICSHKFEDVEHFAKIIMLCRFAGIYVDIYIESTDDLDHYPYIGIYYKDGHLDRWGAIAWEKAQLVTKVTAKELEVILVERIKTEVA